MPLNGAEFWERSNGLILYDGPRPDTVEGIIAESKTLESEYGFLTVPWVF